MSTLLYSLGRWAYRHPWRVLVSWLLLLAIVGGSAAVFMKGTDDSFTIPGTEAQEGIELLNRTFPQAAGASAQLVIVAADGESVAQSPYSEAIDAFLTEVETVQDVAGATDPFDDMVTGLVTDSGSAAIVQIQLDGQLTDISDETVNALESARDDLRAELPDGSQVALGGELFSVAIPGLTIMEAVGVLIALFVLIITFRSFSVSFFPLISALIGVGLAVALIFLSTAFSTISSTTPMLAVMLGLAVGIDYALFIVARHQDQVRAGIEPEESAARATGTAGSAVVFAGVTVLIALIGLSFAGIPFLTTMGVAASVAVAIAVLVAVTLTPALLGFAGEKVKGWPVSQRGLRLGKKKTDAAPAASASSSASTGPKYNRWVMLVTRHPIVTTIVVIAGLATLAIPATNLTLALPNAGVQPTSSEARQAYDLSAENFGAGSNGPLVMTGTIVTSTDPLGLMDDLTAEIEKVPGVDHVALATPNETADTALIHIVPETAPDDPATADLVRALRDLAPSLSDEYGVDLVVTGFTAVGIDISDRLGAALLPFGIFVVGLSLVLLMIVFRSIWVPITAALGYLLSVTAAFGIVAAVFEWGWFADLLHVARTGPVISFMPIILMGVLFGLAMDYQVFLVTRMREDYVHSKRYRQGRPDNATAISAVRSGYTASARVVAAAALIMFAVFAAFVPEGDSSIKPIALGLAAGVAIDAFVVRMTLIPAIMALLGKSAWYIPPWLDRMLPHFDIEGEAVEHEVAHADWPEPETTAAIVGENVGVDDLYRGANFRVEPGGTLVVTGDSTASDALLLTIAGRLTVDEGLLRVGGHLLPGRSAWVRRHVGVALLGDGTDPAADVRRALAGGTEIVVIGGIDRVAATERLAVAEALATASGEATCVISTEREGAVLGLLATAGRRDVMSCPVTNTPESDGARRSAEPRHTPADAENEVNA